MKKLLTMIMGFAVGAFAYGETTGGNYGITSFEGDEKQTLSYTLGTDDDTVVTNYADLGLSAYSYTAATNPRYKEFLETNDKFLNVKNAINSTDPTKIALSEAKTIDDKTCFDSVVYFTAGVDETDEANYPSLNGAKIGVWLKGSEDDGDTKGETNLYVTAGYYDSTKETPEYVAKAFKIKNSTVKPGEWHRVTIRTLGNVYASGSALPGFVVYIDGAIVAADASDGYLGISGLTTEAAKFIANKQLFISAAGVSSTTFSQVEFAGNGYVDDVSITYGKDMPGFAYPATPVTITWQEGLTGFDYKIANGETVSVTTADKESITVEMEDDQLITFSNCTTTNAADKALVVKPIGEWTKDGFGISGESFKFNSIYVTTAAAIEIGVQAVAYQVTIEGVGGYTNAVDALAYLESEKGKTFAGRVSFLTEVESGYYKFPEGTTIDVANGGVWTVNVPEDEWLKNTYGVNAEKQVTVNGNLKISGTIYGNGRVETKLTVANGTCRILLAGLTVGDSSDGEGAALIIGEDGELSLEESEDEPITKAKITLGANGRVLSKKALTIGDVFAVVEGKVVKGRQLTEGTYANYYEYKLVQSGFMLLIGEAETGTEYETFAEALAAANDGDTIKFLKNADFSGESMISIAKTITLDLNGKNVTGNNVTGNTSGEKTFEIVGGKTLTVTATGSTLTGVRINVGKAGPSEGNLVINGGTWTTAENTLVHVNGYCVDSDVTISGATMSADGDNGVQFNGLGSFAIANSSITGATAVYMKGGTLAVTASTLVANRATKIDPKDNGNGSDATGDAVVLDTNSDYNHALSFTVDAASTISSTAGYAILETVTRGTSSATLAITDNGADKSGAALGGLGVSAAFTEKVASGGATVTGYLATVNGTAYATLKEAVDAAAADQTVTLLADQTVSVDIEAKVALTLALGNYKLTIADGTTFTVSDDVDVIRGTGGILNLGSISVAADKTLDMTGFVFGAGIIDTQTGTTSGHFAIAAGATVILGTGMSPIAMQTQNAGFFTGTAKGANFVYGSESKIYNGTSWGDTQWLGSGTEANPYQIADESDLFGLKAWVDAAKATSGVYFKQTADIAMTKVWYGIGVNTDGQTPEDPTKTNGKTFSGVYDGNGKTVSNILFSRTEYQGFFNTISNGVVKALTLATVGYDTEGTAGCGGGVLVGVAYDSTFDHIVINGSAINATHNASGFAVKAHYTTFTYCTNNAAIASTGNKRVAGFVCFNSSMAGGITFEHCANNGNLSVKYNSNTDYGIGGFVGVAQANGVDGNVVFTDCVNKGTITQTDVTVGATELCCGSFVGGVQQFRNNAISATGCSAQSGVKSVGFVKAGSGATLDTSRITGLGFATVADGVATFNATPVNGDYVMFDNAAATIALGTTLTLNESVSTNSPATITAKYGEVARAETATADVYDYTATFKAPWAGEGTAESPYEIAEVADLTALKEIVDGGLMATAGVYFEQQKEIDFADAGEWAGIGGKQSEANSFQGTYDGQGYKIKNVQFVGGKYMGFFRSIKNATIKNLTIATTGMTCLLSDDEGLGIFVGYEYGTLNSFYDCVAEGTVSVNHTAAGFVCGGGAQLYFSNCVNKATLTTTSSKAGGFVGINTVGNVNDQFIDCRNEGNVTGTTTASDGALGGFYGYLTNVKSHKATFKNCVNTGTITDNGPLARDSAFASPNAGTIINLGGCQAQATLKPFAPNPAYLDKCAQVGFTFATVADGVATYIPDADLVKDTTYTLMTAYSDAATTNFVLQAVGDTFKVDTNGYAFAGTIAAADGLKATQSVEGSVITWTAEAASTPVKPGDEKSYETEEDAKAATNNFVVTAATPAVKTLFAEDTEGFKAYQALFKPVITKVSDSEYKVTVEFTDEATNTLQTAVNTATTAISISEVAAASGTSDISVSTSVKGLYYQMNTSSAVTGFEVKKEELGTGSAITFTGVAKPSTEKGFYKISVSATPQISNE